MTSRRRQPASTLIDRFETASHRGCLITLEGASEQSIEWAAMHERARHLAGVLQDAGVGSRETVAVLGPSSRDLAIAAQAILLCGARLAVLSPPRGGDLSQVRRALSTVQARTLITSAQFDGLSEQLADVAVLPLRTLECATANARYSAPIVEMRDIAVLQLTSGTTRDARAVAVSHGNIGSYLDAVAETLTFDPTTDALVSWLPLYHDMGLVGYLLAAMTTGASLLLVPTDHFIKNPARWAQWVGRFERVTSGGPNFAYALLARALRRREGDLSSWRVAINGGEFIDSDSARQFVRTIGHGFPPSAMTCGYGLAEATLGVTLSEGGNGISLDTVDSSTLQEGGKAVACASDATDTMTFVRLGRPLPGVRVRIVGHAGAQLPEREIGEIQVRGPTVTQGYFGDEIASSRLFDGGWLRTGDLGYVVDHEVIVCSRLSDLIVIRGRNVPATEVERIASTAPGIRLDGATAFGVRQNTGRDDLIVVVEIARPTAATAREIERRIRQEIGIAPADVVVVAPGRVPRTSSGKRRRNECRREFLDGMYQR